MCDDLEIINNGHREIYHSIRPDGACLCGSTEDEIIKFVVEKIKPQKGYRIIIEKTPFGWQALAKIQQ
jgi:hypothetical protein